MLQKLCSKNLLFISLIFSLLINGCGKPLVEDEIASEPEEFVSENNIADDDFTIALIDSVIPIKVSDLLKRINNSGVLLKGGYLDSTTYIDTLGNIILDSVLSLEAENVNLNQDFDERFTYVDRYRAFYIDYLYRKLILDSIQVDSTQIDSFYQANEEMFTIHEQVHARHLIVSKMGLITGPDSAFYVNFNIDQLDSIVETRINDYYAMYQAGATIAELASQYSHHAESAHNGGDLGYFKRGTYSPDFENVVFSMKVGEVSKPFKTPDGWDIAEVIDHVDSGKVPLAGQYYDMARTQVENGEARKRALAFVDSLNQIAEYEFNDSALALPVATVDKDVWSVIINHRDTLYFVKLGPLFSDQARRLGKTDLAVADKHDALKQISRQILIMQAGDDLGFGDDSTVVATRKALAHKYKKAILVNQSHNPDFMVTDSMIEAYYDANRDQFLIEKPMKVQHIIVQDSIYGEFLRDQAMSGVDFLKLARENYPGAEEIRVAAADLGYIGPDEMPPEFYDAALRTTVGDVSHPVKTEFGYHIIKVVDRKMNKSLDQVKGQISTELRTRHQREHFQDWKEKLLSNHKIKYFLNDLKRIKILSRKERKLF